MRTVKQLGFLDRLVDQARTNKHPEVSAAVASSPNASLQMEFCMHRILERKIVGYRIIIQDSFWAQPLVRPSPPACLILSDISADPGYLLQAQNEVNVFQYRASCARDAATIQTSSKGYRRHGNLQRFHTSVQPL